MPSLSLVFKIAPTNWDSENTNLTTTCGRLHTIRHTNCMNLRNSAAINSGSGNGNNNDVGGKINCVFLWRVMRVKWKVKRLSDNVSRRTVRRAALPSQQICIEAVLQQIRKKTTSEQAKLNIMELPRTTVDLLFASLDYRNDQAAEKRMGQVTARTTRHIDL